MAAASQTDYTSDDEETVHPESETHSFRSSRSSVSNDFNDPNISLILDRVEDWQTVTSVATEYNPYYNIGTSCHQRTI